MSNEKRLQIIRRNTGSKSLHKGEVREGVQLVSWDCIQECDPERCPIGLKCLHATQSFGKQCMLQVDYINELTTTILDQFPDIAVDDMYRFGMHLVPLYSNLCRMKIVEWSLRDIMVEDSRGNLKIHPIYAEIRNTIKTITSVWRDMGFLRPPGIGGPSVPGESAFGRNNGYGDPNHYARISQQEDKHDVIR